MAKNLSNEWIKTIFSGIDGQEHILHLNVPSMDKFAIQSTFLADKKNAAYVTFDDKEIVHQRLDSFLAGKNISVITPGHMDELNSFENVVVDAATTTFFFWGGGRARILTIFNIQGERLEKK